MRANIPSNETKNKYLKAIKRGVFSDTELIYFRKLVNGSSRLPVEEKQDLVSAFEQVAETKGIRLTRKQQSFGKTWLYKKCYKLNGEVRKSPILGIRERVVLKHFTKFTCVGLYDLRDGWSNYNQYVPIYRCHSRGGMYFDYICKMWGEIEVIGGGAL